MKKLTLSALCVLALSSNVFCVTKAVKTTPKLVSIDSILLMQKSKEGKKLAEKLQKDVDAFQKFAQNAQKEIVDYQGNIKKQAKALSKEALIEKGEKLEKMRKTAERDLTDKEQDLKRKIQREQAVLRNKQMAVVNEVFEEKKWGLLIDKNTPGVLFVAKSIDKTEEVLKVVDKNYEQEVAKKVVAQQTSKKSISTKTA